MKMIVKLSATAMVVILLFLASGLAQARIDPFLQTNTKPILLTEQISHALNQYAKIPADQTYWPPGQFPCFFPKWDPHCIQFLSPSASPSP
ncbi:hypothetical protein ISN44_As02g001550 [Arabidopsis suecica]|uniref:Uncharacterized protein n=1 Tax=Arabidopsis suecica TaxID=45249 RepID=A0A8T2FZP0_ARASU|nr:hypothetical protein ISN44_As02g001550 [Arabidopsis suecica]